VTPGHSLTEVARLSGVSLASASRVLNPDSHHPVSDDVRERVLAAAAQLNYSSNALARGLKTRRTQTVAVIVHDIRDPYFNECARGVADVAEDAGYLTMICNSDRDPETEIRYVEMVQQHRVAGILFVGGGLESAAYRRAIKRQVEAIRAYGGHAIALGPRGDRLPAEVPDNQGGARIATEHLIELGHERIAYVDGPAGLRTSRDRLKGYREALEAAGRALDDRLVERGGYSERGGADAMRRLLDAEPAITAVFASNDAMALGCMQELDRRGMRLPDDMSLVGFDDIPVVRWLNPPLTTVGVPMNEIGAAGMRRLLALLEGDGAASRRRVTVHPTELVVRASTGAPRARAAR
jgi:LacI family transcriptional regulator, galactose operon repressor